MMNRTLLTLVCCGWDMCGGLPRFEPGDLTLAMLVEEGKRS